MQKTSVFGEVPGGFQTDDNMPAESVERWGFVNSDNEGPGPEPRTGPTERRVAVTEDELDRLFDEIENPPPSKDDYKQKGERYTQQGIAPGTSAGADGSGGDSDADDEPPSPLSVDLPLLPMTESVGQHWEIGPGTSGIFGTRRQALHSFGAAAGQNPDAGEDIGVVIVDVGLTRAYVDAIGRPGTYGGGWKRFGGTPIKGLYDPGKYENPTGRIADGHGNMIARNVLSLAPKATIYDAPILPERVLELMPFASHARSIYQAIKRTIRNTNNDGNHPQHSHWIIVNAWGVATSFADRQGKLRYADNRRHRLNNIIIKLARMKNVDIVFAAGNSGAFQPARYSGPYDRGHMRSIWGANGLDEVFTIGAVRTDGLSIGASSQGLAPDGLVKQPFTGDNQKPDFSAPSWFAEDNDRSLLNTGSSAACGIFSGMLAAHRSNGDSTPSEDLKQQWFATASGGGVWNAQRGHGTVLLPGVSA